MSNPGGEPCLASEATPFAGASTFHTGANQLESDGDIGGLLLGEFNLGQAGGCALECIELVKTRGTGVDCSPAGVSGLNLDDGVGELRVLLLLLL